MQEILVFLGGVALILLAYNAYINLRVRVIYRDFDEVTFTKSLYARGFKVKVTTYDFEVGRHWQDTIHITFIGTYDDGAVTRGG